MRIKLKADQSFLNKMKIIIITQDDPFYLGKHIDYFFGKLPPWVNILGVILLNVSPFGKTDSFLDKMKRTYSVFGFCFFLRYSFHFIKTKIFKRSLLIRNVLKKYNINELKLPRRNINSEQCVSMLRAFRPDLIVSIAANQIFKRGLLELPRYGCFNLHTAMLPKYKGLMPAFWALKNNETKIGISVFRMDEGIDTGGIIMQKIICVGETETLESLINKSKKVGMDALLDSIFLIRGGPYNLKKFQPNEGSYYSFPTRKDVEEFKNAGKKFW